MLGGTVDASLIGLTLVLYNTGTDYSAYLGNNAAQITGVPSATQITYDNSIAFPFPIPPSSQQRFFVVDMPISYICSGGRLWRYQNYGIQLNQLIAANGGNINGVAPSLVTNNVAGCTFSYNPAGIGARQGLVTLEITIRDAPTNESIVLMYQTHVANIP